MDGDPQRIRGGGPKPPSKASSYPVISRLSIKQVFDSSDFLTEVEMFDILWSTQTYQRIDFSTNMKHTITNDNMFMCYIHMELYERM